MYAKVGEISAAEGSVNQPRSEVGGALVVQTLAGQYTELVRQGRVFCAANQAEVAITAALAVAYTGLVLVNPASSGKLFALLGCGYSTDKAVPTAGLIGIMGGVNAGDAAAAVTPQNMLIGAGNASVAIVDNGCTLTGTPVLYRTFGLSCTEAVTAGNVGPDHWIDLGGAPMLRENTYVAFYASAACAAAYFFSFMWAELDA